MQSFKICYSTQSKGKYRIKCKCLIQMNLNRRKKTCFLIFTQSCHFHFFPFLPSFNKCNMGQRVPWAPVMRQPDYISAGIARLILSYEWATFAGALIRTFARSGWVPTCATHLCHRCLSCVKLRWRFSPAQCQLTVHCSLAHMWKGNPYGAGWREGPVESWFGSAPARHIEMF